MKIIKKAFAAKTVNAVTGDLQAQIDALRNVAELQKVEAEKQQHILTAAQAALKGAVSEAARASAVADRLQALIETA